MIQTKKYFIRLMNIVNLYLFIWSIGNADFDSWEKNPVKEFFFIHALDRIKFYLINNEEIKKLN